MKKLKFSLIVLLIKLGCTSNVFGQVNRELEIVAELNIRPGNVAVSNTGRVFATIHPLGTGNVQVIEVKSKDNFAPYPNNTLQKTDKSSDDKFDTPLGITFSDDGNLWIVDLGLWLGKTRLWCIDINTNSIIRKIELSQDIAPKGSFVQDLRVDSKNGWVYLADIANPGIIALNLKTEQATRYNFPECQPQNIDMIIDGKVIFFGGKPARVGVNPITLSSDNNTLFFGAMNGKKWYSLNAKLIRDGSNEKLIASSIKTVGSKPICDGSTTDKYNNHYFTNLERHAITKMDVKGKLTDLLINPQLKWPDNISLAPNGYIYISVNQLNYTKAFTGGNDEGVPPYYIYRFKYN
jgi:sugar lactone lactonase YvrE